MKIQSKIINSGGYLKIQIVSVNEGFSKYLVNGNWVNRSLEPEIFEDEILTLGNYFELYEDAEKFINTKFFKSLFKNVEKNFK